MLLSPAGLIPVMFCSLSHERLVDFFQVHIVAYRKIIIRILKKIVFVDVKTTSLQEVLNKRPPDTSAVVCLKHQDDS